MLRSCKNKEFIRRKLKGKKQKKKEATSQSDPSFLIRFFVDPSLKTEREGEESMCQKFVESRATKILKKEFELSIEISLESGRTALPSLLLIPWKHVASQLPHDCRYREKC